MRIAENERHGRDGALRRLYAAARRPLCLTLRFVQLLSDFAFLATNIFQMALEKR